MNQRNVAQPPSAVLVVGGAGFLGSHIVDRLLSDGSRVDVVDDLSSGSLANLSSARTSAPDGALRIHTLDVTIPEFGEVVRLRRPEVMYVTSLLTPTTSDADGCTKAYAVAVAVYEAAVQAKVAKVVITLPAAVLYGEVPAREMPIKEDRERRPVGLAGVTAMAIIELCELYRRNHGIEFTVLALSTVYGTRQRPDNNVVSAFVSAVSTGASPNISGDGKQTRDFLFVDDAADAASRACTKGGGWCCTLARDNKPVSKICGRSSAEEVPHKLLRNPLIICSASHCQLHGRVYIWDGRLGRQLPKVSVK